MLIIRYIYIYWEEKLSVICNGEENLNNENLNNRPIRVGGGDRI